VQCVQIPLSHHCVRAWRWHAVPLACVCLTLALSAQPSAPVRGGGGDREPAAVDAPRAINVETAARPSVRAFRTSVRPVIDGVLNEAEWSQAPAITNFVQQLPRTGYPATFPTVVRVLFDSDHLYIGATLVDPEPRKAIVAGKERDFTSGTSDLFGLVLDTFKDRRNSFLFVVNPAGAVRDEQTYNDSRTVVEAWEGVTKVRTTIGDSAWYVEMEIPLRTLRFDATRSPQEWGLNFIRRVRRASETSYWSPLERQYRVHRMSKAGTLTGLDSLRPGRNLQIKPYTVASNSTGLQVPASAVGTSGDVGVDVKYGVTPSLTLDATWNTDFSQVEVDQEQVNLTRFSLLFPERREFFIENSGAFLFGDVAERNYRMGASPSDFTFFNSRQIGLTPDGRPIPIVGGARLTGRIGQWDVGALDMQTQRAFNTPAENFGVLRARRNLFGKSDIGVLLQNRAATDSTTWNRSAGVDANLRLGGNTIINAYAARSDAAGTARDGSAARVQMAYRGKLWDNSLLIKRVTESFSPGIGFVRRRNFQQFYTTIGAHPRPAVRGVAELNPYVLVDYITDLRSQLDTRTLAAGLDVTLRSEAVLSMLVSDQFDRIEQTFTLVPGRTVAPGAYGWREGTAKFTMAPGSRLQGTANATIGDFYTGSRRSVGGGVVWRVAPSLGIETTYQRNAVSLASGDFVANLAGLRVRYAYSTTLLSSAFVQYNTQTRSFSTNARINWRWAPLSDVFLVYTDRRDSESWAQNERSVALKITRMFAF
jgi:Domain of unknown function (DUF5916)/Carbohydrate family 9 binding domain-like